ncbi:hypothetical protein [Oleiagrimonas soli]|uniref:hypothetical protein n=1 Tax=Oleiagrimonas soli TaxID=1543381 RepID=UPI001F32A1F8|nr:hypothetical protein [Oleiagrimonas soli]
MTRPLGREYECDERGINACRRHAGKSRRRRPRLISPSSFRAIGATPRQHKDTLQPPSAKERAMGTLIAKHYRTTLFAKLADHTYVECGAGGKTWSCWGGSTGGKVLRSGTGSTKRADEIAGAKERAGITCYLVNGVCHQAANRILLPAQITVRGARGYWISSSLYGVYGRESGVLGMCKAPFHKHPDVSGDLDACRDGKRADIDASQPDARELAFLKTSLELTQEAESAATAKSLNASALHDLQVRMFDELMRYRIGEHLVNTKSHDHMLGMRREIEEKHTEIEATFAPNAENVDAFVENNNALAEEFQRRAADLLDDETYVRLFDHPKDEILVVGDPEIARQAYADRPRPPRPRNR